MKTEALEKFKKECEEMRQKIKAAGALGPWYGETDRVEFEIEKLPCIVSRNPNLFFFCGYVGVPKSHPYFGKQYHEINPDVHGGLTYSESGKGGLICCEDENLWWFGFDCGHSGDIAPGMAIVSLDSLLMEGTYRDAPYVISEVTNLARQLAAVS